VRRLVTLAILVVAARAFAADAPRATRIRWLGVTTVGRAGKTFANNFERTLEKASAAHLAVALRQLGLSMVSLPPSAAEASAECSFATRVARCRVTVQASGTTAAPHAERRAAIPFHDAEDLAESLALLVSDMLTTQLPEVLQPPPPEKVADKTNEARVDEAARAQAEEAAQERAAEAERRAAEAERQRAAAEARAQKAELARQAAYDARAGGTAPPRYSPAHVLVEAAVAGVFTFGAANPTVGGARVRVLWEGGPLRAGGTLSLGGSSQSADGYSIGWFRGLVAPRVGAGLRRGRVVFDATAGPGLLVAYADAHAAGQHALVSLAFVVGPALGIALGHGLALSLGADLQVAVTDEKVESGTTVVAGLSRVALEGWLGLSWRH
jgi:hypothetical protein